MPRSGPGDYHPQPMGTHTLEICPSCAGGDSTAVDLSADHELRRCTACSLVYAANYADPDDIYVDGYLSGETMYGLDIFDPLFQEFLDFAASKRMDVIEPLVGSAGSMLDVGCGAGEVLHVAQRRGWRVAGAEPVEESAEIARRRGLDVRTAMLADAGLPERDWDVVSAFHVLEHVTDGVSFLRSLSGWAKPGGLVVIEVPNWGSVERERRQAEWPMLRPLEHIAHYEAATLRSTFERAGLEPVIVRSMGFLWEKQTLEQQLADLAHQRWGPLLRPVTRTRTRDGRTGRFPGAVLHRVLLTTQAWYDRGHRGQVVLGVARVPA